jgi:hypothetical protein
MQVSTRSPTRAITMLPAGTERAAKDVRRYFEYSQSGVEVIEDGLQELTFGEFLIANAVLDRYQLFRALQMQDRLPGVRLGEAAAALGYTTIHVIEQMYERFCRLPSV